MSTLCRRARSFVANLSMHRTRIVHTCGLVSARRTPSRHRDRVFCECLATRSVLPTTSHDDQSTFKGSPMRSPHFRGILSALVLLIALRVG